MKIKYGECHCGCGGKTRLAKWSNKTYGYIKGEPKRFIHRHTRGRPADDRFWEKVQKTDTCWVWIGCTGKDGYGEFKYLNKAEKAHRFSYNLHKGEIPKGLAIDHLCGNRPCVNPDHLEVVTYTENNRRGRQSKLNMEKANEIRELWKTGKYKQGQIGEMYGVGQQSVSRIIAEIQWKPV